MTDERNFDHLARAWLDLGPDEAPDRVIAAVLQAADTTPQVRRALRLPRWRSYPMSRMPIVAVIAAALVVVIGGGLLITRSNEPSGVVTPVDTSPPRLGPSATPAVSGSPVAAAVPTALRSTWIGPRRTIPELPATQRFRFTLTDSLLQFPNDESRDAALISTASAPSSDELALVSTETNTGCPKGDTGRYRWSLSPGGVRLTLSAIDDTCVARSAALVGEWTHVACTNIADACFGDLEAGTFASQYFAPRLPHGASWAPDWGALTYTVPAGWANSVDLPNVFSLTPSADYAKEGPDGPPGGSTNEIDVYRLPGEAAQSGGCDGARLSGVPTVDSLIGYVSSFKGLVATAPAAIDIDGHAAKWIDVSVSSTKTSCSKAPNDIPPVHVLSRGDPNLDSYTVTVSGAERERFIFIDLGAGAVGLVVIDSSDPARFESLVSQAMPIIETFTFK